MPGVSIHIEGLSKSFDRKRILSDVTLSLGDGNALAITGRNGSGKSTLLKIMAGLMSPTKGTVSVQIDEKEIHHDEWYRHLGFVSPYLQLYEEFTAWENLSIGRSIRGLPRDDNTLTSLLHRVGLYERRHDDVRTFSSGMKQRLKYAFALLHHPQILLLDEPRTNLDEDGIRIVSELIDEQKKHGIVIVATNDADDVLKCNVSFDLNEMAARRPAG